MATDKHAQGAPQLDFATGTLVKFRERPWVVLQHPDPLMMMLKPLGGTDAEIVGLYLPLYASISNASPKEIRRSALHNLSIVSYSFNPPQAVDLNSNFNTVNIFYNACRLSFRDVVGPFQSLGRLSFEPRPYQMVPLILALRQAKVRLMIADDVGIGKTLESLLIAKELLDRKEIKRFAVICLPHLCEQWQNEIKDKFGLDAQIIRNSTISRIEKTLRADQNVFRDVPFQVISIDYIKQENRRQIFIDHCPDFVIVDEAHTCACPVSVGNKGKQQRHQLLHELSNKPGQQLVLLTATPHSGHNEEFQSLIALLDPKFASYSLDTAKEREELSHYFVQRRRADIQAYLNEGEVVFPQRASFKVVAKGKGKKQGEQLEPENFIHDESYQNLLGAIINYVQEGVSRVQGEDKRKQRYTYWDLLALMRGVMSSPAAGISMLENKLAKKKGDDLEEVERIDEKQSRFSFNSYLKDLLNGDDALPESYVDATRSEIESLNQFKLSLEEITAQDKDNKVKRAWQFVQMALSLGKSPIVFCQYIQTAKYVGAYIAKHLKEDKKLKSVAVETITSHLSDEERKVKLDALVNAPKHVLVCTDCLSEGVNLQNDFDTVIHYDLPWNPNRLEQRNGRIDRFGQLSPEITIVTLHSDSNPVDDIVLKVLYRKQKEIKKKLGVYLPIADNDENLMESIMERVMDYNFTQHGARQGGLFDNLPDTLYDESNLLYSLERMEEFEKQSRTYFAHNNKRTDPRHLITALNQAKSVIGSVEDTKDFVIGVLKHILNFTVTEDAPLCYSFNQSQVEGLESKELRGYLLELTNLSAPSGKKNSKNNLIRISFASPTPRGYTYIGRNHGIVEYLSRRVINDTLNAKVVQNEAGEQCLSTQGREFISCRALVVQTSLVKTRTTVLMLRVRNVISDIKNPERKLVGEEMVFMGYEGAIEDQELLLPDEARDLVLSLNKDKDLQGNEISFAPVLKSLQVTSFNGVTQWLQDEAQLRKYTDDMGLQRAKHLVQSFVQYRNFDNCPEYKVVEPVLPMDVIAAYVFLPLPRL